MPTRNPITTLTYHYRQEAGKAATLELVSQVHLPPVETQAFLQEFYGKHKHPHISYQLSSELGRGANGIVYIAKAAYSNAKSIIPTWKESKAIKYAYVAKENIIHLNTEETCFRALNGGLTSLTHSKMKPQHQSEEVFQCILLTGLLKGKNLFQALHENKDKVARLKMLLATLKALYQMHEGNYKKDGLGLVHGDCSSKNVMITEITQRNGKKDYQVKFCDLNHTCVNFQKAGKQASTLLRATQACDYFTPDRPIKYIDRETNKLVIEEKRPGIPYDDLFSLAYWTRHFSTTMQELYVEAHNLHDSDVDLFEAMQDVKAKDSILAVSEELQTAIAIKQAAAEAAKAATLARFRTIAEARVQAELRIDKAQQNQSKALTSAKIMGSHNSLSENTSPETSSNSEIMKLLCTPPPAQSQSRRPGSTPRTSSRPTPVSRVTPDRSNSRLSGSYSPLVKAAIQASAERRARQARLGRSDLNRRLFT
jgi:serine/threonine protein kinase